MGWSDDVHVRRAVRDIDRSAEASVALAHRFGGGLPLTSAKAVRSASTPAARPPLPVGPTVDDGLMPLLLMGAAVCSSALQRALPGKRGQAASPAKKRIPADRMPAPILVSPRGDRPKTPRGDRPKTPRRVQFSDEPEFEGEIPRTPRTPRSAGRPPLHPPPPSPSPPRPPPPPLPEAEPQASAPAVRRPHFERRLALPSLPRLPPMPRGSAVRDAVITPPTRLARYVITAPLQLAAVFLAACQQAADSASEGVGRAVGPPIASMRKRRRRAQRLSPRDAQVHIAGRDQRFIERLLTIAAKGVPFIMALAVHRSRQSMFLSTQRSSLLQQAASPTPPGSGGRPRRASVDIPSLNLAGQAVCGSKSDPPQPSTPLKEAPPKQSVRDPAPALLSVWFARMSADGSCSCAASALGNRPQVLLTRSLT